MSPTPEARRYLDELIKLLLPLVREVVRDVVQQALNDRLLTVDEAAKVSGRTPGAIRKLIHRGRLPVVRVGRSVRIRRSALLHPDANHGRG